MCDTDIRRMHGLGSSAHDYIEFHKRMKLEFGHLEWSRQDRTFMKAIDEYTICEPVRRETPNRANFNMTLLSIFFVAGWSRLIILKLWKAVA